MYSIDSREDDELSIPFRYFHPYHYERQAHLKFMRSNRHYYLLFRIKGIQNYRDKAPVRTSS